MEPLSLPGFELLGKLGQGGMATVWKARQLSLDRLVAIKVLSPRIASDPADIERFHTECRSAAMLKHPGIVQVYDAVVHKGLYCLIMEYVAGESLGERIRRKKKMTEDEVLFVLEHVALALGHAWKTAGLIHCDIKPDNILIDADGSVKVTDLGLATTIGAMTSIAQSDEVMGTPQFMSPEQIQGEPKLDCRTDIFSMGATLYQMLAGRMLFEGATDDDVLELQLKGQAPDVMDLVPALSSRISWMTEKMLARSRDQRHADWPAVTLDVERLMRRHFPAAPFPSPGASVMKRSARRQKPQAHVPTPTSAARTGPVSVLRTLLLVAILAALGATTFYIYSEIRKAETAPPVPSAPPLTQPALPTRPTPESRGSEMLTFARTWWKNNPGRYQEAIDRFERVSRDTQGTPFALMALDDIRSVKQARDAASLQIMDQLKATADPLAAQGRFQDAATVYTAYSGPLSGETARDRNARAGALLEQDARETAARQAREQEAQLLYAKALDQAASAAIQNPLTNALAVLAEVEGRAMLAPRLAALKTVSALIRQAASMDRKIMDSFAAQLGKEVTVQLASGPRTLVVSSAANSVVQGDQKVTVGEGVAAAIVKITFTLDELAPRERLQRMGAETEPDVALWKGNAAALTRNFENARTCFSRVPGDFGAALLAALDRHEAELRAARDSGPAPVETAIPATPAGPVVSAEAFTALLVKANSGLTAWEIACEQDSLERVIKVVCNSRYLQNLEPFRALAPSLSELYLPKTQVASLAPLASLSNLKRLDLSDTPLADLGPLKDLRLDFLALNNTRIKDLGPLRGMPLRELEIANTRVFAFDALRALSLTRLNLANTQFGDLSYIRDMPLTELTLSGTKVFDFTILRRYQKLAVFLAENTGFRDASILADLPIHTLSLANSKITDLSPLRQPTLRNLNLSGNAFRDLAGLRGLTLATLRIDNCKIKDLAPLAGMPLQSFSCNGSLVDDLTPLRGAPLAELEAANTPLSDLTPVAEMPLRKVVLSYSKVSNVRPLARCPLRELRCEGLRPENLPSLRDTPLEILYCDMRRDHFPMGLRQLFPNLMEFNGNTWPRQNQP